MILLRTLPLLLLAACAPGHSPTETRGEVPAAGTAAAPFDAAALSANTWHLARATDAAGARIAVLFPAPGGPLQLAFADGRLAISGGCNQLSGGYTLRGDRLEVEALAQTKMFCGGGALMAADEAIAQRLRGPATLSRDAGGALLLTTAGGDVLAFDGAPTAAARYGGDGERLFLEVAAQRVPCSHPLIPDHRCLHVRELSYDDAGVRRSAGDWQFLYQEIEGYTHQPGTRNVLRVDRYRVANPPADASSLAYVLDMVVESETVPAP